MKTNKILFFVLAILIGLNFFISKAKADEYRYKEERTQTYDNSRARISDVGSMLEDTDGVLEKNEFEYISTNQSITRSLCPYACSARGIPKQNCRTWKSIQEPTKCYVQDLRLPSTAIEFR